MSENKTDDLRKDILHNAPLPTDTGEDVAFSDIKKIQFVTGVNGVGTFMEVMHYEVGPDNNLIIILK